MWIPAPLYKRAPQYWLFLGFFLVVTSTYLALETQQPYVLGGAFVGLACCAWSAIIFWRRAFIRAHGQQHIIESPESA